MKPLKTKNAYPALAAERKEDKQMNTREQLLIAVNVVGGIIEQNEWFARHNVYVDAASAQKNRQEIEALRVAVQVLRDHIADVGKKVEGEGA